MSEERMVVAPVGYLTVLKFPAQLPYYCMEQTGSEWMYCRKFFNFIYKSVLESFVFLRFQMICYSEEKEHSFIWKFLRLTKCSFKCVLSKYIFMTNNM